MTLERVLVAGAESLIGSGLVAELERRRTPTILGRDVEPHTWRDRAQTVALLAELRPDVVFVAAGHSGGIARNIAHPASLMLDNLLVASHLLDAAQRAGVRRLLYVASSCCYPRDCPQPMQEHALFSGPVETTSEPYANAKLAAIKLCDAYRREHGARFVAVIPGDAYGPGDDFHPEHSHVVAALIRRMILARREAAPEVVVWGSGRPRRDFTFIEDLARGLLHVAEHYDGDIPINVGSGTPHSIRELAEAIKAVTGYTGTLRFDTSKPDGMPLKALDSSRLHALGFHARTKLLDGLKATVDWYEPLATAGTGRPP